MKIILSIKLYEMQVLLKDIPSAQRKTHAFKMMLRILLQSTAETFPA